MADGRVGTGRDGRQSQPLARTLGVVQRSNGTNVQHACKIREALLLSAVGSAAVGRRRATTPQRGYGHQHQQASKRTRAAQPWCSWCSSTEDLVSDHLIAGRPEFGYRTLCRPCNNRRARGFNGPDPART